MTHSGGYILSVNEDLPKINDIIKSNSFTMLIKSMIGTRIDRVRLTHNKQDQEKTTVN